MYKRHYKTTLLSENAVRIFLNLRVNKLGNFVLYDIFKFQISKKKIMLVYIVF